MADGSTAMPFYSSNFTYTIQRVRDTTPMIKISSICTLQNWLKILFVCSIFTGCGTYSSDKGNSNRLSTPDRETQTVVWGNDSGAVSHSIDWLNKHKFLVVDRWVEERGDERKLTLDDMTKRQNHMLSVAQKVGAPMIVFVHVKGRPNEQNISSLSGDNRLARNMEVEIRGVNADTEDIVFGANVWNSEPLVDSEQMVQNLTTFALQKAWNESEGTLPPQKGMAQQTPPSQEEASGTSSDSAKLAPTRDLLHSELNRSLPPQPLGVQQMPKQVSVAKAYSETMPAILTASHSEVDRSPPLQPEVVQQTPQQEEGSLASSYSEEISPAPEASMAETDESQLSNEEPSLGLQIASGALSVLYTPIKVVYAVFGGFFGGFAYILTGGNEETATSIWDPSLGGTYLLRPEHLRGDESILFMGESSDIGNAI